MIDRSDILQWFKYDHLPEDLQSISKQFHDLAHAMSSELVDGSEKSVTLRKLLEAKDAAVRATRHDWK